MRCIAGGTLCAVFSLLASGQELPVTVIKQGPDTRTGTVFWKRGEPTFELMPQGADARSGHVWVSSSAAGLLIEGEVNGPKPVWPTERGEMLSKDHIEVWLAAERQVNLPPIGWGNQFGETDLKSESDCSLPSAQGITHENDVCRAWFREQVDYREQFKRLFVRQWLLAGDAATSSTHVVEVYASSAMANIAANFFRDYVPTAIEPVLKDGVRMAVLETAKDSPGYGFQISIPIRHFRRCRR